MLLSTPNFIHMRLSSVNNSYSSYYDDIMVIHACPIPLKVHIPVQCSYRIHLAVIYVGRDGAPVLVRCRHEGFDRHAGNVLDGELRF